MTSPPPIVSATRGAAAFPKSRLRSLVGVFLGLASIVPLLGFGIVYLHAPRLHEQAFAELRTIADLKASQIESWLGERRGNATVFTASAGFIERVERWLHTGDASAREGVVERLEAVKQAYDYDGLALL